MYVLQIPSALYGAGVGYQADTPMQNKSLLCHVSCGYKSPLRPFRVQAHVKKYISMIHVSFDTPF